MMYFDSAGGAAALLSNYAAAVSNTMQEPWRNLSCPSTSCCSCVFTFSSK